MDFYNNFSSSVLTSREFFLDISLRTNIEISFFWAKEGEISKNAATTILRTLLRSTAKGQVFLGTVTINLFVSAGLELTI